MFLFHLNELISFYILEKKFLVLTNYSIKFNSIQFLFIYVNKYKIFILAATIVVYIFNVRWTSQVFHRFVRHFGQSSADF